MTKVLKITIGYNSFYTYDPDGSAVKAILRNSVFTQEKHVSNGESYPQRKEGYEVKAAKITIEAAEIRDMWDKDYHKSTFAFEPGESFEPEGYKERTSGWIGEPNEPEIGEAE